MTEPLISIIIPVYNVENYLGRCFQSVQKQTYKNLEIILIDDGSTDASGKLCDQYKLHDQRVKVIHQKNGGLSNARNSGLKIAKGEYITFLDSDDLFGSNDYLEELYKKIVDTKSDLAVCAIKELWPKKELDYGQNFQQETMDPEIALKHMLNEQGFNVSAYAKLYHKRLWKNVEFPDGKLHEDLGTTYKLFMKSKQIIYIPKIKYFYVRREGSIASSNFTPRKLDILDFTDEMCAEIDQKFKALKNVTNLRRIHARFSVLCQVSKRTHPKLEKELVAYIKAHKNYILKNPEASLKDKVAIRTLLLSKKLFRLIWGIYNRHREIAL